MAMVHRIPQKNQKAAEKAENIVLKQLHYWVSDHGKV